MSASRHHHPIHAPAPRERGGAFERSEVALANRNRGLPLELLRHDVTPTGAHYLLTHFDVPAIDQETWRLSVDGQVERPFSMSLADLDALPQETRRVTLECAGNGRANRADRNHTMPWMEGGVSTAEWSGVPLARLLEEAGVSERAVEIAFRGADRGFDDGHEHHFGRSLPLAEALREEVLVATRLNGAPLPPQHGAPARLVVPGWFGMASVKWLVEIEALERPFEGFQQVRTYRYRTRPDEEGEPITRQRVKSLMVPPGIPDWFTRHRVVDAGRVELAGRAWSGGGTAIERVQVRVDDGPWRDAELEAQECAHAWVGWRIAWDAEPGDHTLACRAMDASGAVQPDEPPPDWAGFGNNAVQSVTVTVRDSREREGAKNRPANKGETS